MIYNDKDVSAGPDIEPLTIQQVKLFLKIEQNDEDELLNALITSAREHVEDYTSKNLTTQAITRYVDTIGQCGFIKLRDPLQSVGSVTTYDDSDAPTVIDPANYYVDTVKGRLVWRTGYRLPQPERAANGLVIEYAAGYGDAPEDVPSAIVQAMKALIAHLYEHREELKEMPFTVKALLQPYRVIRV